MDKTVPAGAALLLDFIGGIEAPRGYDTIYGNNQGKLPKPLTSMTLDEVIAAGPSWTKAYKSSACGRYQFMNATLRGLKADLNLAGGQRFDADFQDRIALQLLRRRGYDAFMTGTINAVEFGKRLAQEWASLPVLAPTKGGSRNVVRGQSFYAGDKLNKSLVTPERVEMILQSVKAASSSPHAPLPRPAEPAKPTQSAAKPATPTAGAVVVAIIIALAAGAAFFLTR